MSGFEEALSKEGLGQYAALLLEAGATSVEDLALLSDADLKDMGVEKVIHRRKLMKLGQEKATPVAGVGAASGESAPTEIPSASTPEQQRKRTREDDADGQTRPTATTADAAANSSAPPSSTPKPASPTPSNTAFLNAMELGRKHRSDFSVEKNDFEQSKALRAALAAFEEAKRHAATALEKERALGNIVTVRRDLCLAFSAENRFDRLPQFLDLVSGVDEVQKLVQEEFPEGSIESFGELLDVSLRAAIANRHEFGRTSNDLIGHLERLTHDLRFSKLTRSCLMVHVLTHHHKRAVVLGEEKEFVKMRSSIQSCESMSIALDQMLETLQAPCSPEFVEKMKKDGKEVLADLQTTKGLAEGRVWLNRGKDCFHKAKADSDRMMQHTFDALDNLRHCLAGTTQADLAIEAEAQSFFGQVFEKVMKNDEAAERHYKESIRLAMACAPRYFGDQGWFKDADKFVRVLQVKRQEKERADREKERAPHLQANKKALDALKKAQKKGEAELLKHVYTKYKPCGMTKPDAALSGNRNAVKALVHFHPDKVKGPMLRKSN